jgi:hypothetical protein
LAPQGSPFFRRNLKFTVLQVSLPSLVSPAQLSPFISCQLVLLCYK